MKAFYFIVTSIIALGLVSCSTDDFSTSEELSVQSLVNTYGATNLYAETSQTQDLDLNELTGMSAAEAYAILGDIRKHQASQKETRTFEEQRSAKVLYNVEMSETVSDKYTIFLQLNLMKDANGLLFYNGYEADGLSDSMKWYRKGFSFSCDNSQPGCYKFETQGYLYFKVIDGNAQFLKVPFKVTGTYNTTTQAVNFNYSL